MLKTRALLKTALWLWNGFNLHENRNYYYTSYNSPIYLYSIGNSAFSIENFVTFTKLYIITIVIMLLLLYIMIRKKKKEDPLYSRIDSQLWTQSRG